MPAAYAQGHGGTTRTIPRTVPRSCFGCAATRGHAAAIAYICDQLDGSIVNISSGAATSARLGAAGYSGSKAAINMLTQALAIELGPYGIRVNAVAPGLVTDVALTSTDQNLTPYMQMMLEMTPLGRTAAPADIAEGVGFVASDRNAWMTGSIIDVTGGSHTGRAGAGDDALFER